MCTICICAHSISACDEPLPLHLVCARIVVVTRERERNRKFDFFRIFNMNLIEFFIDVSVQQLELAEG